MFPPLRRQVKAEFSTFTPKDQNQLITRQRTGGGGGGERGGGEHTGAATTAVYP